MLGDWSSPFAEIDMPNDIDDATFPTPQTDNDTLPDEAWEDAPEDDTLIPDDDPVLPPVTPL